MKRTFSLLAVVALSGCAASTSGVPEVLDAAPEESGPSLAGAVEICGLSDSALMDEGASLMLDGRGEDDRASTPGKLDVEELACALVALEVSEATISKMSSTRALDGMQSASDKNFEYTWTYHPDNGLDIIVTTLED